MEKMKQRTIGMHPCVGKKASGVERPTSVVIRHTDGTHEAYEFAEQGLLDFFTCGAVIAWRDATVVDVGRPHPAHHLRWQDTDEQAYTAYAPVDAARIDAERGMLFRILREASMDAVVGYQRLQAPAQIVELDPAADIVGVASGGLGYQVMEVLLGRYPDIDFRVIGSGTLKEHRAAFDQLLPKPLQRKAAKVRAAASDALAAAPEEDADADEDEADPPSKAAAKDANAKFDAHRIAYGLTDDTLVKLFQRCTLRDRDWAAVQVAYGVLEMARKARVAAEQQFRQAHRSELRRLVKDPRVPYVTLGTGDEDDQNVETLLASYEATLRICVLDDGRVTQRMQLLRHAYARIAGARAHEKEMEAHLQQALDALPEYTEFLVQAKAAVDAESGLPLGKYIGERIFGRWIAGFGSPMVSRIHEPMRPADTARIAACRAALTEAIAAVDRSGLPEQPPIGNGKTREWMLTCERLLNERTALAQPDQGEQLARQRAQVIAAHDAYRTLVNANKCAANRPLNRVIAFMGLHVRQGGKYAGTPKDREFPRRRKGGRANWNERLLRQGAYHWAKGILRGGDSYWKHHVYAPYKQRCIAAGMAKGLADRRATWRMTTVMVRWLINEWFAWERRRAKVEHPEEKVAA
ncbi:hypothetical protein HY632_03195 [Candidatus Uhrbacteria bacterium]|nr:hypothetical protein [Candidatus Uhrbacteria bacterium]